MRPLVLSLWSPWFKQWATFPAAARSWIVANRWSFFHSFCQAEENLCGMGNPMRCVAPAHSSKNPIFLCGMAPSQLEAHGKSCSYSSMPAKCPCSQNGVSIARDIQFGRWPQPPRSALWLKNSLIVCHEPAPVASATESIGSLIDYCWNQGLPLLRRQGPKKIPHSFIFDGISRAIWNCHTTSMHWPDNTACHWSVFGGTGCVNLASLPPRISQTCASAKRADCWRQPPSTSKKSRAAPDSATHFISHAGFPSRSACHRGDSEGNAMLNPRQAAILAFSGGIYSGLG